MDELNAMVNGTCRAILEWAYRYRAAYNAIVDWALRSVNNSLLVLVSGKQEGQCHRVYEAFLMLLCY